MVQVADWYTDLGSTGSGAETNMPAGVYSFCENDGIHLNELGTQVAANSILKAINRLNPIADGTGILGLCETSSSPSPVHGTRRKYRNSGQVYTPDYCAAGSTYTQAAGILWAFPMEITECNEQWGSVIVELIANTVTGNNLRVGYYDDIQGLGYPQLLRNELTSGGAFNCGTTPGVKTIGTWNHAMHTGLYWLVLKIDAVSATPGTMRTIVGPSRTLPNWLAAGGAVTPVAWTVSGLSAGALPTYFPTGATLASSAPMIGITVNLM
jgi:hypothetical protein